MIAEVGAEANPSRAVQILVVEDEGIVARDIREALENLGYSVPAISSSGQDAIALASEIRPDLVLMDIRLKGEMDGIQAAEQIWGRLQIPIVYSTGFSDKPTLERAKRTRPFGYILKPIEERELYVAIETALQQHRATQELQSREKWLNTVLRDIGDGVIVVDTQLRIQLLNIVAEALTGWSQVEAAGKDLTQVFRIIHAETQETVPNPAAQALQQERLVYLADQTLLVNRQGDRIPITDSAAPTRDDTGAITGAAIVFRDRTQRLLAEERELALRKAQQLEVQMAELEKLNQMKDEFINTISHDLRTPLSNMKMAIHMLEIALNQQSSLASLSNQTGSRMARYLDILRDQCNQEILLVNDLLDLQRVNANVYPRVPTRIHLQEWVSRIAANFEDRVCSSRQQFQVHLSTAVPQVISDEISLTRILSELLNNACKYTPSGDRITVTIHTAQAAAQSQATATQHDASASTPQSLQIQVSNSGVEIPVDEQERIFEKFYRIPNADLRSVGGTGLGLTLVKKLVEHLGGAIRVESGSGQTSFIVEVPLNMEE